MSMVEKIQYGAQSNSLLSPNGDEKRVDNFHDNLPPTLTAQDDKKPRYYKPFILQLPSLAVLLGVTLILIAVVEFACQRLPHAENRGLVGSINNRTGLMDELLPRQLEGVNNEITTPTPVDNSASETPVNDISSSSIPGPSPSPEEVLTSVLTSVIDETSTTYTVEYTLSREPSGQAGPVPSGSFAASSAITKNWLTLGTRTIPPKSAPANNNDPGQTPVFNTPTNPTPPEPVPVNPVAPGATDVQQVPPQANPTENAATPQISVVAFIPVVTAVTDKAGNVVQTTVPVALDKEGNTIAVPTNMISADATTTFLLASSKTRSTNSPASNAAAQDDSQAVTQVFTKREYVLGAFIPTVIAVLFAIPFGLIDAAAKEMEPIFQLSTPGGASGTNSLALDYASASMFVTPFQAFNRKHWMIFVTSVLGPLSLLSAPLAVESVFISLKGKCDADTDSLQCYPTLSVYKTSARVLEAVLATMAILLGVLMYLAHKRRSAVRAEPISLAGIASLMHNQEYLAIVRDLPSYGVNEKALLRMLPPLQYTIDNYQNADGTWGYGFKVHRGNDTSGQVYTNSSNYVNVNLQNQLPTDDQLEFDAKSMSTWARFIRLAQLCGFLALLLGLTVIVIYYRFFETTDGFGNFMSNQRFGVKFMFTSLGVIISQFWAYAREKIHRHEPYHSLTTLKSPPRKSILKSPALAPITSVFTSIALLSPLLICLDLSCILAEALIITLSNIPFSSATTQEAWIICNYISLTILVFMVLTLGLILVRIGRFGAAEAGGEPPVTILGKSVLLCGSMMLERFEGLAEVSGRERDKRVKGWGKLYGLGRVRGVDGVVRKGVDFREYVDIGN